MSKEKQKTKNQSQEREEIADFRKTYPFNKNAREMADLRTIYPFITEAMDEEPSDSKIVDRDLLEAKMLMQKVEDLIQPTFHALDEEKANTLRWHIFLKKEETDKRFATRKPMPASERWPYFYALPQKESEYFDGSSLKMMPYNQQRFMEAFFPHNKSLLNQWMRSFAANFGLVNRSSDFKLMRSWAMMGYPEIRQALELHPAAASLTDLRSMRQIVAEGLESKKAGGVDIWRFYDRFFMPGPERLAVALPVGLVIFEGHKEGERVDSLIDARVRRAPFSTSWHPNEAMCFTDDSRRYVFDLDVKYKREKCLFVHKITSQGILGIDLQQTNSSDGERQLSWTECEVIIQPLVNMHLVKELVICMEMRLRYDEEHEKGYTVPVFQRTLFTHLFLGDTCPCFKQ